MERHVPGRTAEGHGQVLRQHVLAGGLAACQQQVFAAEQRRQRLRNYTEIYLEYLTQQNYISGYIFTRTGRVVDGVEIVLDRTTRKPAPTPELTLPDETNKGRFKPNKQKPRKRNMIR